MPEKIQQLARHILNEPEEIKLAVSKPAEKIEQSVYLCHESQKDHLLRHVLTNNLSNRVIVFAGAKQKVKELARGTRIRGMKVGEMHSDLDQNVREQVMLDFKSGKINILFATDIVARGIDVDDIEMVINYDVPREGEDYVHRIGRTARANRAGKAVTLVSHNDLRRLKFIEKLLEMEIPRDEWPSELGEAPIFVDNSNRGRGGRGKNSKNQRNKKKYHRRALART